MSEKPFEFHQLLPLGADNTPYRTLTDEFNMADMLGKLQLLANLRMVPFDLAWPLLHPLPLFRYRLQSIVGVQAAVATAARVCSKRFS